MQTLGAPVSKGVPSAGSQQTVVRGVRGTLRGKKQATQRPLKQLSTVVKNRRRHRHSVVKAPPVGPWIATVRGYVSTGRILWVANPGGRTRIRSIPTWLG